MQNYSQFVELKFCKKIWAIGSIHSHVESFESIKKHILDNFRKEWYKNNFQFSKHVIS